MPMLIYFPQFDGPIFCSYLGIYLPTVNKLIHAVNNWCCEEKSFYVLILHLMLALHLFPGKQMPQCS